MATHLSQTIQEVIDAVYVFLPSCRHLLSAALDVQTLGWRSLILVFRDVAMGIGVTFSRITCHLETAESERRLRRRRIRRRGSDEVVIFASLQDAIERRHLAFYRYHTSGLDSGDSIEVNQSMLAAEDSTNNVALVVVGWEIDGPGVIGAISTDEIRARSQPAYDAWTDLPPFPLFGDPLALDRWLDDWVGGDLIMLSAVWAQFWEDDNVVSSPRGLASGYDYNSFISRNTDLEVTRRELVRPRVFGPVHREFFRYQSSTQHSDYSLEFEFRGVRGR